MANIESHKLLDRPDTINAFLEMIGGTRIDPTPHRMIRTTESSRSTMTNGSPLSNLSSLDQESHSPVFHESHGNFQTNEDSGTTTPIVDSQAPSLSSSPTAAGIRAPPPTPATRATTHETSAILEPIEEDETDVLRELANQSNLTLNDSHFGDQLASPYQRGPLNAEQMLKQSLQRFTVQNDFLVRKNGRETDHVENMAEMKLTDTPSKPVTPPSSTKHSVATEKHKENKPPIAQASDSTGNSSLVSTTSKIDQVVRPTSSSDEYSCVNPASEMSSQDKVTHETQFRANYNPEAREFQSSPGSIANSQFPKTPIKDEFGKDNIHDSAEALHRAKAELTSKVASRSKGQGSPTIVITCSTDDEEVENQEEDEEEQEDREHAKLFKTWGNPPARDKPRSFLTEHILAVERISDVNIVSRVRKVILTGLPAGSDLNLVQSLISGGAIDTFTVSPNGLTAYVTFTTGDDCDKFYNKYPNGISFRLRGKSHVVYVDKANQVDVVSGMLQGYLDCGATRCVRAVGADNDWTIKALHNIATGPKGVRRVENIIDTYRNEIRSIIFRFASISDAVAFKGKLMGDEDWEACNIQFMDDPCQKAEDLHFE